MDWSEYKRLCDQPRIFSRWMLEQTLELMHGDSLLADVLTDALRGPVLDKPVDHHGGRATDMLMLRLDSAQAELVLKRVEWAVSLNQRTTETQNRGLGGFVPAWREYLNFLQTGGNRRG